MRDLRIPLTALLGIAVVWCFGSFATSASSTSLQPQSTALERGYRTGYSDGYDAGYKDVADGAPSNFQNKPDYQRANRSYNEVWGPLEDYRDGYQQGFAAGYNTGYQRNPFNSSIPSGLHRRETLETPSSVQADNSGDETVRQAGPGPTGALVIPRDSILTVELLSNLSTDVSQRGDPFQARVVQPSELEGAMVEGRLSSVKRSGKVRGVAELQLSFEQIRLPDGRSSAFNAEVVGVIDMGRSDGAGEVDPEGGVKGRDSTKDDVSKVGATTGIGAIIGAIAGGGKGAAIGAAIGGAAGAGGVLSTRGKDLRLPRGQQLRIRSSSEIHFP